MLRLQPANYTLLSPVDSLFLSFSTCLNFRSSQFTFIHLKSPHYCKFIKRWMQSMVWYKKTEWMIWAQWTNCSANDLCVSNTLLSYEHFVESWKLQNIICFVGRDKCVPNTKIIIITICNEMKLKEMKTETDCTTFTSVLVTNLTNTVCDRI